MSDTNNEEHLVRVTAALYRVTGLWDDDEPLREDMRETANAIVEMIMERRYDEAKARVMMGYLSVAEAAGSADPMNFRVLKREYGLVFDVAREAAEDVQRKSEEQGRERTPQVEKAQNMPPEIKPHIEDNPQYGGADAGFNERQKKILERLAVSGQAKISDFYAHFNGISSKTIQRDLQDLATKNLIKKEGEKRWTIYMMA